MRVRRRTELSSASYLSAYRGYSQGTLSTQVCVVKKQLHAKRHFTCNVRRAECNATAVNATATWTRRNRYNDADAVPDCSALSYASACKLGAQPGSHRLFLPRGGRGRLSGIRGRRLLQTTRRTYTAFPRPTPLTKGEQWRHARHADDCMH